MEDLLMDTLDCIKARKSIRHFAPDEPPRAVLLDCLEAAAWAPNPTTQQPWTFIVLTGNTLKKVSRVIEHNFALAQQHKEARVVSEINAATHALLEGRKSRSFGEMITFLKANGVDMQSLGHGNFCFHNAPVGIIFATYPCKDQNFYKATVAAMENFLIAATAKGLGTCWMNAVSICQEYIKEALKLPAELIVVDGVAVGYAVPDSPLNRVPRSRLPVDDVTLWL
jgi:nitroreductase